MSRPTILSSTPAVRYQDDLDDDTPPPAQMVHLTRTPDGQFTASAMGITVTHPRRDVALSECERQLAAQPAAWEQTVDRQFRPI